MKLGIRAAAIAGLAATGIELWAAGPQILPRAIDAWDWIAAADDPVQLTELGLKARLTPEALQDELQSALDADDIDLAESFVALADQQGLSIPDALRARLAAATGAAASARRGARDFYSGLIDGESATGAGLAGVIAGDLTGVGDVRDLVREGQKIVRGEEPDQLVLGLAAAGLVLTGATIASVGVALPARAGVSTLRVATKSGRLSKPLAGELTRLARDVVDPGALALAATAAGKFEVTAAKAALANAVRPASLARLRNVAEDVTTIGRRAGVRSAHEALAITTDTAEIRRIARLAETRGAGTRAVLKVLGRGAIALTSGAALLAGWVMAGVGYVWLALMFTLALVRRAAKITLWSGRNFTRLALRTIRPAASPRSHAPR